MSLDLKKCLINKLKYHPIQRVFIDSLTDEQLEALSNFACDFNHVTTLSDGTIVGGALKAVANEVFGMDEVCFTNVEGSANDPAVVESVQAELDRWKDTRPWDLAEPISTLEILADALLCGGGVEDIDGYLKDVVPRLMEMYVTARNYCDAAFALRKGA